MIDDERVLSVLEEAIEWHRDDENQERMEEFDHVGFDASAVNAGGWEFNKLKKESLIEQTYSASSSPAQWRLVDIDQAEEYLERAQSPAQPQGTDVETIEESELFRDVVGREKPKKWFRRTIQEDEQVHHLLVGEPGSGKSMILDDIARLPKSERVVMSGNQSSAAGVRDVLIELQPDYLVVEEIEKGSKSDREALMTLCGQGYVTKTKSGKRAQYNLDTTVFAAGNDPDLITPPSLVDRFMKWEFERYDLQEFKRVCGTVLPREHDTSEYLTEHIAQQVYEVLGSSSVREAERIAKLAENQEDVDELIAVRA